MSLLASETKSIYFGIGRRKASVAKVILVPGTGAIVVNNRQGEKYLQFNSHYITASKIPLTTLGLENTYTISNKSFTGMSLYICLRCRSGNRGFFVRYKHT